VNDSIARWGSSTRHLGVVDDLVDVPTRFHAVLGAERIGVERRTGFNVLVDGLFQLVLPGGLDDAKTDSAAIIAMTRQ
jgi:hypothetical protein